MGDDPDWDRDRNYSKQEWELADWLPDTIDDDGDTKTNHDDGPDLEEFRYSSSSSDSSSS